MKMKKIVFSRQQRIVHTLMLQTTQSVSDGLLNGRAGIALYLYYAGRLLRQPYYAAFAADLTEHVLADLHQGMPTGFKDGLVGFGWFAEHLFRHGFEEGNRDDVLEGLDAWMRDKIDGPEGDDAITDLFVYFSERLSGRSPAGCLPALSAAFDAVLRRLSRSGDWLDKACEGKERFDLLWPYPWLIYYVHRLCEAGYGNPELHAVGRMLEARMPALDVPETAPGNRLLLSLVQGKGVPEKLRPALSRAAMLPYEQAWSIILLYVFDRANSRETILSLYDALYAFDEGDTYCAGFRPEGKSGFRLGLYQGVAAIGLAGLLAERLTE